MKDLSKILFAVAILILCAVGAYFAYKYLQKQESAVGAGEASTYSPYEVSLDIVPDKETVSVGEEFEVRLYLKVRGDRIASSDLLLYYSKDIAEAVSIEEGVTFIDYPNKEISKDEGEVLISGIASVEEPFTGSGTAATVRFKALAAGNLSLNVYNSDTGDFVGSLVVSSHSGENVLGNSDEVTVEVTNI